MTLLVWNATADSVLRHCASASLALAVKASVSRARRPGFDSRFLRGSLFRSSQTTGSVLGMVGLVSVYTATDEIESLICNFYLSVALRSLRPVPEIHWHVAGTLATNPQPSPCEQELWPSPALSSPFTSRRYLLSSAECVCLCHVHLWL